VHRGDLRTSLGRLLRALSKAPDAAR